MNFVKRTINSACDSSQYTAIKSTKKAENKTIQKQSNQNHSTIINLEKVNLKIKTPGKVTKRLVKYELEKFLTKYLFNIVEQKIKKLKYANVKRDQSCIKNGLYKSYDYLIDNVKKEQINKFSHQDLKDAFYLKGEKNLSELDIRLYGLLSDNSNRLKYQTKYDFPSCSKIISSKMKPTEKRYPNKYRSLKMNSLKSLSKSLTRSSNLLSCPSKFKDNINENNVIEKQTNVNDTQSDDEDETEDSDKEPTEDSNIEPTEDSYIETKDSFIVETITDIEEYDNPKKETVSVMSSILYMDACSLWKFPPWLVERLNIDKIIKNITTLSVEQYRSILMRQLKSTACDLLLYQSVRREFLRTILVIELNNIVKLMENLTKLGLDNKLKNKFFLRLKPIVAALDNTENIYIPQMEEMASILNELFVMISPVHVIKGNVSYHFNIIYCSYLIPHRAVHFNENCPGGIVDNVWFANESKYYCMVMVTPQIQQNFKSELNKFEDRKFRVEAYFDIDKGRYPGFEIDFTHSMDPKFVFGSTLENLIYSYLTKESHWVEDKNIFILNGPETKGNINFTRIYFSLLKKGKL